MTKEKYGKTYISGSNGKYQVSEAAKETVVYNMMKDDSISEDEMYEYMNRLNIEPGYIKMIVKDGHYWR